MLINFKENFLKTLTCPSGKWRINSTSPTTKSTSPGLSDLNFFVPCAIKHSAYVTRMLYGIIMHAAYVTRLSACNFFNIIFIKEIKNLYSCIVELYEHLGIFKNTHKVLEALGYASCFSVHFSCVLKNSCMLIWLDNALGHIFYFFSNLLFIIVS